MRKAICWLLWMSLVGGVWGQQASSTPGTVPTVIRFSGNLADGSGKALGGMVGVTFSLYKDERGGAPLWVETQNVVADKSGHYSVTLGSTTTQGLPQAIFASGEARWLGVQPQGQAERPRVLLMSVPYALKAADAETVGGLPASAFALAAPSSRAPTLVTAGSPPVGGSGTTSYIPIWTDSTGDLGNSVLFQTGSGSSAKVGLNTTTPVAALDVGSGDLSVSGGNIDLPQTSTSNVGVVNMGGIPFLHACCGSSEFNTFVGTNAGSLAVTGAFNTGVGYQALMHNTVGTNNTATGYQALATNDAGFGNTASGYFALTLNQGGDYNTAFGESTLTLNVKGSANTAVGQGALNQTAKGNNTGLGFSAGLTNTLGTQNTFVGASADAAVSDLTYATAIGAGAIVNENNALVLGGTGSSAVKVGIGTATPAATLDVQGTGNFSGLVTFAPGQTFGGTGTITGVNTPAGSGLMGGGTTGTLNLSLLSTCSTGQVLSWNGSGWVCTGLSGGGTITGVTAGTDLLGGGTSGNVTLNLDTTKVPLLGAANNFQAPQTVGVGDLAITGGNLDLPQTGGGNVGVITFGGAPFIHDCCAYSDGNTSVGVSAGPFNLGSKYNTAEGFQTLTSTTGSNNTGSGYQALISDGKGNSNTAVGYQALYQNTSGNLNTAVGNSAGFTNTTAGSNNTLVGAGADVGADGLTFATAIGSNAIVNESNALVLGGTGANAVKVGIGTATPGATLDVQGTANFSGLITFAPGQTFGGTGTITGVNTPAGGGLMGGGTSGTLNLSLLNTCASGQVLSWSGSTWVCTSLSGGGTITGVIAGTDLTGGGTSGNVTLNVDTTQVPQLGTANSFAGTQTVNGLVAITGSGNGVQFPDGTLQTTAASGGGGIPSGFMILGSSPNAPPGYTLSGTNITGNVSSPASPLIEGRSGLAAATSKGKLYAIGGYNGRSRSTLKTVEEYDPSLDTWSSAASMSTARDGLAAAVDATTGKIYAIGGHQNGTSVLSVVEMYDPSTKHWALETAMPTAREGLAAVVDPTTRKIYAIGGDTGRSALTTVEVYDPSSNTWTTAQGMHTARSGLAAAFVNGKIYAIGGGKPNSNLFLNTVEVYDLSTHHWSSAPPIQKARSGLAAAALNGKIYAIGGSIKSSRGSQTVNTVEIYDPSANSWSRAPSPLVASTSLAVTTVPGFIYVIGGASGSTSLSTVEQYSPPVILYTFTKN